MKQKQTNNIIRTPTAVQCRAVYIRNYNVHMRKNKKIRKKKADEEREPIERVDVVPAIPLAEPFNLQLTKHFNTHTQRAHPSFLFFFFCSFIAPAAMYSVFSVYMWPGAIYGFVFSFFFREQRERYTLSAATMR